MSTDGPVRAGSLAIPYQNLEFEKAALLRDRVVELRRELADDEEGLETIAALCRGGGPMPRLHAVDGRTDTITPVVKPAALVAA